MTIEIDWDEVVKVDLDDEGFDVATEAATQAHVAGFDPSIQLEMGLKAYLWIMLKKTIQNISEEEIIAAMKELQKVYGEPTGNSD